MFKKKTSFILPAKRIYTYIYIFVKEDTCRAFGSSEATFVVFSGAHLAVASG